MTDMLPSVPVFVAFLAASFVLAVTPGPGVFYIVTRSLVQGRRAGFASVAGVALGNLGNALAASIGLAALLSVSSVAFLIVKYVGAGYLIYLGIQALRSSAPASVREQAKLTPLSRIFGDGLIVALFNPKTAFFFAAFLPQFMHVETASVWQSVLLGSLFVGIAAVTDSIYALTASAIGPALARYGVVGALGRYLSASVFICLGVLAAAGGPRKR